MTRASLAVRLVAVMLVAVSPWLPARKRASDARSVVFVVDRSDSITSHVGALSSANAFLAEAWAKAGTAELGAIAFDGRAEVIAPLGTRSAPVIGTGKEPTSSDVAAGIRLAVGALPTNGHRSIVLLSDVRPTRGDVESEVRSAASRGIRVDVVPIPTLDQEPTTRGPLVTAVHPRALHVAEGQPVVLDVEVRAAEHARIEWTRDGVPMQMQLLRVANTDYDKPPTAASFESRKTELYDPRPPPGPHVYEVRAKPWRDPSNIETASSTLAAVTVEGKAHAVVFSGTGSVPPILAAALAESGLEARGLPLERANDPAAYSGADAVVLADVRVSGAAVDESAFTRAAQTALVDYVQHGGGLLVTGGVFGLAPEYAGTPLSRILPIEIEDRGHVEDPPVALAIMLDRSGSMGMQVGTHTKIELAIEASLAAADTLRPTDHVAIASVDTQTHWDVPLGAAERLGALRAEVRSVRAGGGGIYVFTALQDAYAALEPVKMPLRHVILFSDTADSEEQQEGRGEMCDYQQCNSKGRTAESIAREARVHGITTTVVGIGDEGAKDTAFLRKLAAAAGGRFYLTAEGSDLRRIFLSETRVLAQSNLREKKTRVALGAVHPALAGIDVGHLPELAGYVETSRRSGADTALVVADDGRPLLATWRYGLGKVGAITTDLTEGWGTAWAESAQATQLLRQTVRHLLREQSAHHADAEVRVADRTVEVAIELPSDSPESAAPTAVDLFAIDKGGTSHPLPASLEANGPGRWIARARSAGESVVVARARDARGAVMAEALGREDRTTELATLGPDEHLAADLARIGDGRVGPSPEGTLARTRTPGVELEATWPWALVLAGFLVVLDLFLRRTGKPRQIDLATLARGRWSHAVR